MFGAVPDQNKNKSYHTFTELAHWAHSVIELQCPCGCLSVHAIAKHPLPNVMESSG